MKLTNNQIKAMATASLEMQIEGAQEAGDSKKVAQLQRRLAVVVSAVRDERQAEVAETAKSMQYDFTKGRR